MTYRNMKQLLGVALWAGVTVFTAEASALADASASPQLSTSAPPADQPAAPSDSSDALYERGGLTGTGVSVGLKVGSGFSQPFGDLGASLLSELEVGYTLPVAKRAFSVFVSGAYTQPSAQGHNIVDARLPGPAGYEITQQELMLTLGLSYRLHLPTKLLRPYGSIGPRLFLMRTNTQGSAGGQSFGGNQETATRLGLFAALGAELHLGPGAALIEVSMTWASIDGYVLRDTSAGALAIGLGYRLFL
jgi:hypothetical protein